MRMIQHVSCIKPVNQRTVDIRVATMVNCLIDIYIWMSQNKLTLNANKTLCMGNPQIKARIFIPSITIKGVIVPVLNEPVSYLGTAFDPNIIISSDVSKVIKSA